MDALKRFSIPIKGLKSGLHEYHFDLDADFFSHFEGSPVSEGQFGVKIALDKRPEMLVLDLDFSGKIPTDCDRCLDAIQLPLSGTYQMVVKYSDLERDPDEEIIYLPWEAPELNVAQYLYENIILALPMIRTCDELGPDRSCNEDMLKYLDGDPSPSPVEEDEVGENEASIWSELKKKFNPEN
ncbi:MAG: DUF177 domain-containing protein [Bacteroidota bacterium]